MLAVSGLVGGEGKQSEELVSGMSKQYEKLKVVTGLVTEEMQQ